jgi:putative restriction endonuclease
MALFTEGTPEGPESRAIRLGVFDWLKQASLINANEFARAELEHGAVVNGQRIILVGPQGIFKPTQIRYFPLSITTTTKGPYRDAFSTRDEFLLYKYRGTDPMFHENRKLRETIGQNIPLIYFHSTIPGKYLAIWPVFIVGDNPAELAFTVAADDALQLNYPRDDEHPELRRAYVTREQRQRIHQRTFRDRVLQAYEERCTICRLRHAPMLDAAHIIPDTAPEGEPIVPNGLSMCKLHHAGYDRMFFGIRPDYSIEVRRDILEEEDGPMLKHGLQEIHDTRIHVPRSARLRPDPARLERRYEEFETGNREC